MAKKKRARAPQSKAPVASSEVQDIAAPAPSKKATRNRPTPAPATSAYDAGTRWLALPEVRLRWFWVVALIAVAWAFGFIVRLLWLPGAEANPQAVFDGHVTLTVTDGYFWAAGVQRAVEGLNEGIRRIPPLWDHALVMFGAVGAQLAPLQDVIVYLPAIIAPLVVAPLVILGNLLRAPYWGFAAGLLASVGWSYYSRTLMGYFDTDMFSVTVPLVLTVAMIAAITGRSTTRMLVAATLFVLAPFFYDQIAPVLFALAGILGVYLVVFHDDTPMWWLRALLSLALFIIAGLLFGGSPILAILVAAGGLVVPLLLDRERDAAFIWPAIAVVAIALLPLPWWARLALLVAAWFGLRAELVPSRYLVWVALAVVLAVVVTSPVLHKVLSELTRYTDRGSVGGDAAGDIAFLRVGGLVREMVRLPFPELAARFAGSAAGVALAITGYALACVRYRPLLLLLPLVALGVFSQWGGLRFTIYAVPVAALGLAYLMARGATLAGALVTRAPRGQLALGAVLTVALAAPVLASQVDDALARPAYTVVNSGEADLMTQFGQVAAPNSYAIAWWDFGYPLYYFAHVGALIDGGKHGHDNLVASQVMLTGSQLQAANLSRVAIEGFVAGRSPHRPVIDTLLAEADAAGQTQRAWLASLAEPDYAPPAKTREVYLYLPHKMLSLLGAVEQFSRDARRGDGPTRDPVFVYTPAKEQGGKLILQRGGFTIDLEAMTMQDRAGKPMSVRSFDLVDRGPDGEPRVRTQPAQADGRYRVIFMRAYGAVVLCDLELYDSVLVQLYVLGHYDRALFEPVLRTPYGAVFRVLR